MACPLKNKILQFDRPVPRYTSYPTAPNFKNVVTDTPSYPIINNDKPISLYLHIPFCPKLCWYCGCHTKITRKYDPLADYLPLLLKEIELIAKTQKEPLSVSHIHFGGGSPGMLSASDFKSIMDHLSRFFHILDDAEIAIEIDPREITEDRIATYAQTGVNRISLGVQDFNDDVLKAVNREQPFELSEKTVSLGRQYGIHNFNFDLIYGLPLQTVEKIDHTVNLALSLTPDRLAFFGYAHVPWMKKHMRLIDETTLPDKSLRYDLFNAGANIIENRGYTAIGIDHFAKADDPMTIALENKTLSRNFQGYTTDQSDILIGIGLSSIGKTADTYLQNATDMPSYKAAIEKGLLPLKKYCPITPRDHLISAIIEQIMCYFEVDLDTYQDDFSDVLKTLKKYQDEGLIHIENTVIRLSKKARPVARLVCAAFDDYLPPETEAKHSKAV